MKRILVVEDESDMQEIYRDMFKDNPHGYALEIIGSVESALKRVKEEEFSLAILDIIMEPMSGDSFFVYVRNDPKIKRLPIIVVSVLNPDTLSLLKQFNNISILQKPVTKAQLFREIEKKLDTTSK